MHRTASLRGDLHNARTVNPPVMLPWYELTQVKCLHLKCKQTERLSELLWAFFLIKYYKNMLNKSKDKIVAFFISARLRLTIQCCFFQMVSTYTQNVFSFYVFCSTRIRNCEVCGISSKDWTSSVSLIFCFSASIVCGYNQCYVFVIKRSQMKRNFRLVLVSDEIIFTCNIFWLHWKGYFVTGFNRELQSYYLL